MKTVKEGVLDDLTGIILVQKGDNWYTRDY